jgi:hypothetical protein
MDSPFDYSSPVTGQHFIGRKEDCVLLGSILERSVNAAIWEPTLSGKKSLIQQTLIMLRAKGLRIQTRNLSALDIRSTDAFIKRLGDTVIRMVASTPDEYESILAQQLRGTHFIFDRDVFSKSDEILSAAGPMNEDDMLAVLRLPYILFKDSDERKIVIIDEFQNLDLTEDGDRLFSCMEKAIGERAGEPSGFSYIFMGSQVNAMNSIFMKRHRFYRMHERVKLSRIEEKDIVEHVIKGFLASGKVIDRDLVSGACRLFRCNMFYINFFFSVCDSLSKGYIMEPILLEALEAVMAVNKGRFVAAMNDLTTFQVSLLRAICDGCTKFSTAEVINKYSLNSSANVRRLKDALMKKEIVTFDGLEQKPEFLDSFFEYWLKNVYFKSL